MTLHSMCRPDPACAGRSIATDAIAVDQQALADLKAYLRIDGASEDETLIRLIAAAIGHGEMFTRQMLVARGVRETIGASAAWTRLARGPVSAIGEIDGDGIALAVPAYSVDIDAGGDGWVRLAVPSATRRVTVQYSAGIAAGWAGLPEPLRQGVLRLASHLYAHRDDADEGAPPAAVAALWRPWRRMGLV